MPSRRFVPLLLVLLLAGGSIACQGEDMPADDCPVCAESATCADVNGALACVCPDGLVGDGTAEGTGCQTQDVAPRFTSNTAATFVVGAPGAFRVTTSGLPAATIAAAGEWPDGVAFVLDDDGSGQITGTPEPGSAGAYPIEFTADNGVPPAATQSFTLTVNDGATITSDETVTFVVGTAGTFAFEATGYPAAFTLTNTGDALPAGITLSGEGVLAGMPEIGTGGTYGLVINASNGIGEPATQSFTLTINEAAAVTSADAATFTVGTAGSFTITASGHPAALQVTNVGDALPDGVTLDASGLLAGTPASGTGGTYALRFAITNGVGEAIEQAFTLTVHEAPAITSVASAAFAVGQPGEFLVTASGFPAATITNTGDALPAGITLSGEGVLAGTPEVGTGGTYGLVINASNGIGEPATQSFTLTVNEAAAVTSADVGTFTVGTAGAFTITASGHPTALQVTNVGDALPDGVTLDASGLLSGTPASGTGGTYALRFAISNGVGETVEQAFTLTVHEAPAITSVASTTFAVGQPGEFLVTTSGFPAATITNTGDALPAGVTLSEEGVLAGTPEIGTGGTYGLVINASNGAGEPATQSFTLTVTNSPVITGVSPAILVPGTSATITGANFGDTLAANILTIQEGETPLAVPVTAATTTALTFTVPCLPSASYDLVVTADGKTSNAFSHPIAPVQHALAAGEKVLLSNAEAACNELAATGAPSKYVLSVFSADTSPSSNAPFRISTRAVEAQGIESAAPASDARLATAPSERMVVEDAHGALLEANRRAYATLRRKSSDKGSLSMSPSSVMGPSATLPETRSFLIPNVMSASPCKTSFAVASATRVYLAGKVAIYEDAATPEAFQAAKSPKMAAHYLAIGDQLNSDMEPIIRTHFGDPLRRDAVTDANGVVILLTSPVLNHSLNNLAGFTSMCDQVPNDAGTTNQNTSSNFGEIIYLHQPTQNATGYASNTPDNWFRKIRSTIVHELKHLASYAARIANGAPSQESAWLEEGTALLAEELWARQAVDDLPWKDNHGYGSSANPVSLYCDARPTNAPECAANPLRPASIMMRHFTSLYTMLYGSNARLLSPFGATASDNASYYHAIAWSLLRHALDQHGDSEAAFLTALTQSTATSTANLTAVAGVDIATLLGDWSLALAVDDRPDFAASLPAAQFPTWNFRDVYAGMNADFPGTYTLEYPLAPMQLAFGPSGGEGVATMRGGGVRWYELSGIQTVPQLVRLEANGGGAPPPALRMAIVRVQ